MTPLPQRQSVALVLLTALTVLLTEKQHCGAFAPLVSIRRAAACTSSSCCYHPKIPASITRLRQASLDDDVPTKASKDAVNGDLETSKKVSPLPLPPALLYVLDAVTLLVFAAIGKASHASDGSLDLLATATTAAPFVVAWFVTSPLTGVYQQLDVNSKEATVKDMAVSSLVQTTKGWAIAIPLGCVGRGIIKGYVPPLPFVVVTLVATLVLLGTVRALTAVVSSKLSQ